MSQTCEQQGNHSRAVRITNARNKFRNYIGRDQLEFREITSELISLYEKHLKQSGLTDNTVSYYMRILRSIYNTAVEQNIITQQYPFKKVYTGICKTVKRALIFKDIERISRYNLSDRPRYALARDIFILSFLLRGISLIDLLNLTPNNFHGGYVTYRRRKTGQQLTIKWEDRMQLQYGRICSLYSLIYNKEVSGLFPSVIFGQSKFQVSRSVNSFTHFLDDRLKQIGRELDLPIPLTMYVARHSWASIARDKHISLAVISEGLGHDNERTTQIYLSSIDTITLDAANRKVFEGI